MGSTVSNQIRVGIFLAVGLAGVLVTILLLGGDKAFLKKHVTLYVAMKQVQGLDHGSVVSLSGIVIGNVETIQFPPSGKQDLIVKMKIEEQYLPRLTKGATADVRTQGALGDKYVYITPADATATPLKNGDYLETVTTPDLMDIITQKGGNETEKIFGAIDEIYKLTKTLNAEGRPNTILSNFIDASHDLKLTAEETKKLVAELRLQDTANLKESIQHMNSVFTKIDRGEGTLGALINDPTLHDRLKAMLGGDNRKQAIQSLIRTSIQKSDK
jgi:phospholipid/cholesterol/gamma-HCH transport system substrate-binding protein